MKMKTRFLILATLCFSLAGFSQKKEMKTAEKALKDSNATEAKTALASISEMMATAEDPKGSGGILLLIG